MTVTSVAHTLVELTMKKIVNRISHKTPRPMLPPAMALRRVTSKSGKGVYASTDTLFKGAVFGRDSIEVAEDILLIKPKLVRRIILTLASLQGEVYEDKREEEPGKIIHEYRTAVVDGRRIEGMPRHIFEELSSRWGGNETTMAYYGSVDATPHFIRLLGAYIDLCGDKILGEQIILQSGRTITLQDCVGYALDWIKKKLNESHSGLIEYMRVNPHGIENQVWKDSREFYVHENKQFANHKAPISSIEVQGLTYDALIVAGHLNKDKSEHYQKLAKKLRDRTIELLWQEERRYFALGTDYDDKGNLRVIQTMTGNPAALLDTQFFDDLPNEQRQKYISGIVQTIMGPEFLTDGGIRSRALKEASLVPFWDYHGSYTTWPKETYDVAKGLRRQGFPLLARQLENRILNITFKSHQYPEFIYVDAWGRVLTSSPGAKKHGEVVLVDSAHKPERLQAWTVSAMTAITAHRIRGKFGLMKEPKAKHWQKDLQQRILSHIPYVERLINPFALAARYPTYRYKLIKEHQH